MPAMNVDELTIDRAIEWVSEGSPEQQVDAVAFFKKGHLVGHVESTFQLGVCYVHGVGVDVDQFKGFTLLLDAANQGHTLAQDSVGVRYAQGQGVEKNDFEAVRWFKKSAMNGNPVAHFNLGLAHVFGQGVDVSECEAWAWFSLSAALGDDLAGESRDRIAQKMSLQDLQAAKRLFHRRLGELRERLEA